MKISDVLKNSVYAIVFGFFGLIIGIWIADLLYRLVMKNAESGTTVYVSVIIVLLVIATASVFGFAKGKKLLESS